MVLAKVPFESRNDVEPRVSDFEIAIVGAGAVGLACGYALARRGRSVVVVEKAPQIGSGVSARNSEVIHAGLHYPTGSLKARLCVDGRRALYDFLTTHNVAHQKCGKLIVATEDAEVAKMAAILQQGQANGVEGFAMIEGAAARAMKSGFMRCGRRCRDMRRRGATILSRTRAIRAALTY